jgi:hypothetical protein
MDNLITLKIKATSFDRLIDESMNIKKPLALRQGAQKN